MNDLARRLVLTLGLTLTLWGCSGKVDPKAMLPGKWSGDMSADAIGSRAADLKAQNPSASGADVVAGARTLGMIAPELRADGTVTAVNQTVTYGGKWTLDAAENLVDFDLAQATPAVPEGTKNQTVWIGIVDTASQSLELFMGDRAALDFLKQVNKGSRDGSIVLKKQ